MSDAEAIRERFRIALELFELGERMLRQRLSRERPQADDAQIERYIREWLARRSDDEYRDAPWASVAWPPESRFGR